MIKADQNSSGSIFKKISHKLRLLIGDSKAVQIEAGYINDDLSLTEKGRVAILEKLTEDETINDHLTDLAKEDIEAAKKDCKDKKD